MKGVSGCRHLTSKYLESTLIFSAQEFPFLPPTGFHLLYDGSGTGFLKSVLNFHVFLMCSLQIHQFDPFPLHVFPLHRELY